MAGSSEDARGREIQEGEVVSPCHAGTGSDTDTDDEDARYYLQPHHDDPGVISAVSPPSSFGSYGTISDAGAAAAVASAGFPCPACPREFISWKAVGSHMKVHAKAAQAKEEKVGAVVSGGASAVEEVGDSVYLSMSIAVADPNVSDDITTPVLSACSNNPVVNGGSGSSSPMSCVEPSQSGAAAPEQVPLAAPPAPPQRATYIPLMVPAGSEQAPIARRQKPEGFKCKECDRWFQTHQGLGGHAAGHKNRRLAEEAAAAAAAGMDPQVHLAGRGGPEKPHACKICGAVYKSGVSLGGHMRKHYSGKPIVPRKRMRLCLPLPLPELALAQPLQQQQAPPAVEAQLALAPPLQQQAPPAVEAQLALAPSLQQQAPPAVEAQLALAPPLQQAPPAAPPQLLAGTIRIFGVTIVQQANQEEPPAVEDEQ